MSGYKKVIYIAIAVIILLGALWVLIQKLQLNKNFPDPLSALPENAIIFYKGSHFRTDFNQIAQTDFWNSLNSHQEIRSMVKTYSLLDSAISKYPKLNDYLNSQEIILSLHKISRSKTGILLLLQTMEKFKEDEILEILNTEMGIIAREHHFEGCNIFNYQVKNQQSKLAFTLLDGILAISSSSIIVEDAVRAYHSFTGIIDKTNFGISFAAYKENWFINFRQLPFFLDLFASEDYIDPAKSLSYFAQTANYELDFENESFSLRGSTQTTDTFNGFNSLFLNQTPRKTDISKIASLKSALLCSYHLSDFKTYLQHYQDYLKYSQRWSPYEAEKLNFIKEHQINIENDILPLLKGQFAISLHEPFSEDIKKSKIIYVKVEDVAEATHILREYDSELSQTSPSFHEIYNSHEIYISNKATLFYLLFGISFKLEAKAFFTPIRDYLVFSSDLNSLKQLIDDFNSGQTLSSSSDYHRFADKLVSESNFFSYVNPNRLNGIFEYVLNNTWQEKNLKNSIFNKFETIGFQIVNNKNGFYSELIATFSTSATQNIEKIWEIELDSTFSTKPFIFKNHNTGKWEVVVFDDKNNLYLISNSGEILWKRPFKNKLVGEIFQVDFYKNKKLQYLFTTETHLQLIDRLGRNTANYPIRLSAKASSGIGIYKEGKANTRFFVGTDNNYIFGFNLSGKPLNGWSPQEINGNLQYPIRYFVRSNKTQFFGITDNGSFYRWDLKGNKSSKKVELQTKFSSPLRMRFGIDNEDTYLVSNDSAGNTFFINLADEVEVQRYGNFSPHAFFDYIDLNGDKEKDLIFVDQTSFLCFSKDGAILYSITLEAPSSYPPYFLKLDNNYYVATVNKKGNKLYMVDLNGVPERNFPVECNTPFEFFDLNEDGKIELIAGQGNRLYLSRF